MKGEQFLTQAYYGSLDVERLLSFREEEASDETREIIARFVHLSEQYPPAHLEEAGVVPGDLLDELRAMGFFGLTIDPAYGGVGLSLEQYLKVVEEIASRDLALAILSLAHLSIGTKGIVLFGNEEQKRRYLVPAASGEMIFSYALTEPRTGSDAKHIETIARLSGDGSHYILNGQKTYITNANYAGGLTLFARLDPAQPGSMGAFIVETSWEGITIRKDMPKMGLKASSTAAIHLKDVRVPRENLLGRPGDGFKIAMTVLNYGRVALGAGSSGAMKQSLADMVRRATSRRQFGVPISSFELIQEKIVRARVYSYVSSAMTSFTAGMLGEDPLAPVAIESSHCKLFGTTRAWDTLYDALQVAGGSGYLSTQPYEKRMRDNRVTTIFEGTTEIHSIYPPLFVLRGLSKRVKAGRRGRVAEVVSLIRGMFARSQWLPKFDEPVMNRAARLARANARTIHWLLHIGLLFYGRKVSEREFFLRRITGLSLHLYGLLCSLARVEAARREGRSVRAELRLLAYLVEEARRARKLDKRLFPSRQERLHREIVRDLIS